jgi:predicted ATPase
MDRDVFVGREPELADLERRLVDSRTVGGAVVFCEGDAGMGKTALAAELARRAREQGFRVAWGACLEGEGSTAYRPWVQLVSTLGRTADDLITPAADDNASRFRLFADVVEVLRGAGAESGLLVVLDDLHWADVASLRLLQVVASEVASCRLLVLGLYRGADAYPLAEVAALLPAILRERTASLLTLRGLRRTDVEQLVAELPERPTEDIVRAVHERAEGNPLFVLELLMLMAKLARSGACDRKRPNSARVARLIDACDRKQTQMDSSVCAQGALRAGFQHFASDAPNAECQKLARSESLIAELSSG